MHTRICLCDIHSHTLHEFNEVIDGLLQLLQDLNAPAEVTNEDLVSIVAQPAPLLQRQKDNEEPEVLQVSSDALSMGKWMTSSVVDKSVHHFCILSNGFQLPQLYRDLLRPYHFGLVDEVGPNCVFI